MDESSVVVKWNELKVLVDALELDMQKNANGNAAAGVRVRKGLRQLKKRADDLVKVTIGLEKAKKASKPPKVKKE